MRSHSVICHPTVVNAPLSPPTWQVGTRSTVLRCGHAQHTIDLVDTQLISTMYIISGTLRPTPLPCLSVLANIKPPVLWREAAVDMLVTKVSRHEDWLIAHLHWFYDNWSISLQTDGQTDSKINNRICNQHNVCTCLCIKCVSNVCVVCCSQL